MSALLQLATRITVGASDGNGCFKVGMPDWDVADEAELAGCTRFENKLFRLVVEPKTGMVTEGSVFLIERTLAQFPGFAATQLLDAI